LKELKKWLTALCIIALLLMTLLTGVGFADAEGDAPPPAEEQSLTEGEDSGEAAPDVELEVAEEPAEEEAAAEEEPAEEEAADEGEEEVETLEDKLVIEQPLKLEQDASTSPDEVTVPQEEPVVEEQCDKPERTSLDISKDIDLVTAPGCEISLEKTASDSDITMKPGESKDVTFTITVNADGSSTYYIEGNIFVENTGEYPADVNWVKDTIWYKAGGSTWYEAPSNIITNVPIGDDAIGLGIHTYNYSGTFALPVPASQVTSMSNLIEIEISNHPTPGGGMGDFLFHSREDFDLPGDGQPCVFLLEDIESLEKVDGNPTMGLSYVVKSVTVESSCDDLNGVDALSENGNNNNGLSWELNAECAPYTITIIKTLTARSTGECEHNYILYNTAKIGELTSTANVNIKVTEPCGEICGFKFEDKNCNGKWDRGEPGMGGVAIKLTNLDTQETWETTTNSCGLFCFEDLPPGLFEVEEVVPEGYYATTPNPVQVCLKLPCCMEKKVVFGNAAGGSICGVKFWDKNCNGERDRGEPGVPGITIKLKKGCQIWETTTDENGRYCFTGLKPGLYKVWEIVPEGYTPTTKNPVWVKLCCGGEKQVNFGNARKGKICVLKYWDKNCNGERDDGEPGVPGIKIKLKKGCETWWETTNQNGIACFEDLEPGKYKVKEIVSKDFYPTTENPVWVTLDCGEEKRVAFGNAKYGKICGVKFLDKDCDGEWDCGEPGIKGVTIRLTNLDTQETWCTKTKHNGRYCFENLKPGLYKVEEKVPFGFYLTTENPVEVGLRCGGEKQVNFGNARYGKIWGFKWKDKDCSGGLSCGDWPMCGVEIQLWKDGELIDTDTTCILGIYMFTGLKPGTYTVREVPPEGYYPSYPSGGEYIVELGCGGCAMRCFYNAPYGSICGYKFWDKNCNGEWDDGEPPIEGVQICLYPGVNGNDVLNENGTNNGMCTTTDETGKYCFEDLKPGYYLVYETPPEGFYPTTPNPVPVELGCGENRTRVNFGNANYGSISGTKYLDENCNGEWDEGEPGIPDVRICIDIEDANDEVVPAIENNINGEFPRCTLTDENGDFYFGDLKPGTYIVTVDESTAPENTYPSTDTSVEVPLGCGEDVTGILFGNAPYGEITGLKLVDTDGDDAGDEPLAGVTIELWKDGDLIDSAVTDENGEVVFDKLEAGTYLVKEIVPEGYNNIGATEEEVEICGDEQQVTFVNARFGMISGTKYLDADGDGIIDPDEKVMGGVTINLTEKGKIGALATTQSKDNGTFSFEGLKSSTYIVTEVVPEGYYQTGHADWEVFVGPDDNIPVAFLNAPYGSISGTKWNDVNRNGVADEGETGVGGVTITLNGTTLSGTPVTIVTTTYTDGTYYFSNLEAGTYTVTETIPGGMEATSEASKTVTLIPGEDLTVDFHNAAIVAGEVVTPGAQLPYTGMDQLLLLLAGAGLLLLGLMALALGILRFRGSSA
jgi:protocatechuate 3,4-dioxygenase beta subunit